MTAADWSVIVLAGGRATRLGGADKASLPLGGSTALDVLLAGVPDAVPVVVAGPARPTSRPVEFVAEPVPFGGPVAGIAAALPLIGTTEVVVLAVDAPWSAELLPALLDEREASGADAVIPVTTDGRRQNLCSAWRTAALRAAVASLPDPRGAAMRDLGRACTIHEWRVPPRVEALLQDIDTPDDLARARGRAPRHDQ